MKLRALVNMTVISESKYMPYLADHSHGKKVKDELLEEIIKDTLIKLKCHSYCQLSIK